MAAERRKRGRGPGLQAVSVGLSGAKLLEREPVLLFAASQVEEVLREVEIRPVPFAAEWLLGLCAWRQQVLPVLDAALLYRLPPPAAGVRVLHLVVRIAVPAEAGAMELRRCVLKVSGQIAAAGPPEQSVPAAAEQAGLEAALVRGLFADPQRLLLVPNLLPAVCPAPEPAA